MKTEEEARCTVCSKLFCCKKCRKKHEVKSHANVKKSNAINVASNAKETKSEDQTNLSLNCSICQQKPLALQKDINKQILEHIAKHHMPLYCKKCDKLYTKIEDLKEFSKCTSTNMPSEFAEECCITKKPTDALRVPDIKVVSHNTISTQTSPCPQNLLVDSNDATPMSIINLRWKSKNRITHEEFISDSISSIRNLSSISNSSIRRSIDLLPKVKGKLVRSTSTPVNTELILGKPKEQAFNASGGTQVSSIYNSGCLELDNSPAIPGTSSTSPKQPIDNFNRFIKVGGRPKITAVTPLRQVMSKSIQKAFAEHGGLPTNSARTALVQERKKVVDLIDGTSTQTTNSLNTNSPIDLRLSPALRRTQSCSSSCSTSSNSEIPQIRVLPIRQADVILSSKKLTTESIVITRTEHLSSIETSIDKFSSISNIMASTKNTSDHLRVMSSTSENSAGASIYKSCRSVEIITSTTELSELNLQSVGATYTCANSKVEQTKTKKELLAVEPHPKQFVKNELLIAITPITRIPGAIINKKLIKFDTPKVEKETENESHEAPRNSPVEVFSTPNATPPCASRLANFTPSPKKVQQRRKIFRRNLSNHFSPSPRFAIPEINSYHVEDVRDTNDCKENNQFDEKDYTEKNNLDNEVCEKPVSTAAQSNLLMPDCPNRSGRFWALGSIVSSVMRLPNLKAGAASCNDEGTTENDNSKLKKTKSIIKRCASIAGSLVRSKSSVDEDKIKAFKRKRTNTTANETYSKGFSRLMPTSPDSIIASPPSPISPMAAPKKRFRIQGRKPIDRMRSNL